MKTQFVVTEPFGDYAKGAIISDKDEMAAVVAGALLAHVVRTAVPPEPAPAGKSGDPA